MAGNGNLEEKVLNYDKAEARVKRLDSASVIIKYKGSTYVMEQVPSRCIPGEQIYPYYILDEKGNKKEIADYDTFITLRIIYDRFLEAEKPQKSQQRQSPFKNLNAEEAYAEFEYLLRNKVDKVAKQYMGAPLESKPIGEENALNLSNVEKIIDDTRTAEFRVVYQRVTDNLLALFNARLEQLHNGGYITALEAVEKLEGAQIKIELYLKQKNPILKRAKILG